MSNGNTDNRILDMLARYLWDVEEGGYIVGGWGWQMLWGAELFGDLYGRMAESDQAKTEFFGE